MAEESKYPRTLGVLAGKDMPISLLRKWVDSAEVLLAADAGLDRLLEIGVHPDAAIGDFDSTESLQQFSKEVIRDSDESRTDCDKLLSVAQSKGIGRITLASVEGDHFDHMLATLHSASKSPLAVRIAVRSGAGWILNSGDRVIVNTKQGRRVSLIPLEETKGAILRGVTWPLEGSDLHPSGMTGVSNVSAADTVEAKIESGAAFLFVAFPDEEMPFW
jgi:thiamine pyrophosphokinase